GALPEADDRLVLGRAVPAPRGLDALELEHDEAMRLPAPLELLDLAAADEEPAAVELERPGHVPAVLLVRLRVGDLDVRDHVGGHPCADYSRLRSADGRTRR